MPKGIELLKLDLQHFGADEDVQVTVEETPKNDKIEVTAEELAKQIESESDRKLQSALDKKQKEWAEETENKIKTAIKEQQRLSQLSDEEAFSEKLKQREQDLETKEKELKQLEMLSEARADLKSKGLPETFAELLVDKDAQSTLEKIKEFKTNFDDAVNEAVKEKVRQVTPPSNGKGGASKTVADSFAEARNKAKQDEKKAPNPWATN